LRAKLREPEIRPNSGRLRVSRTLGGHRPVKVAWLGNPGNVATKFNLAAVTQSAEQMGIKVERLEARERSDLDRVFATAAGSDAVPVSFDDLARTYRRQVARLAAWYRSPAILATESTSLPAD
jgi:hypothetical protein